MHFEKVIRFRPRLNECIGDFASFETGDVAGFRLATIRGLSHSEGQYVIAQPFWVGCLKAYARTRNLESSEIMPIPSVNPISRLQLRVS
jgi:hypothetical protein